MSFEEAAAVPQAAVLALQGLRKRDPIRSGLKVLINGAGGGVGSFAVQIAKSFGAEVTGVDSTGKLALLRSLGADQVIDYTQEDFTRNGQRYDLILDMAAHHSIFAYERALSRKGVYVMVGGSTSTLCQVFLLGPILAMTRNKKLSLLMHKPKNTDLISLSELLETGQIAPVIDRRYPLGQIAEAVRYLGEGNAHGKIVITM